MRSMAVIGCDGFMHQSPVQSASFSPFVCCFSSLTKKGKISGCDQTDIKFRLELFKMDFFFFAHFGTIVKSFTADWKKTKTAVFGEMPTLKIKVFLA